MMKAGPQHALADEPAGRGFPGPCCRNITTDGFPGMKMPLPDDIVFIAERFGYEFHRSLI
jgi:hypothetical protein